MKPEHAVDLEALDEAAIAGAEVLDPEGVLFLEKGGMIAAD
jgi:hypothetical protein